MGLWPWTKRKQVRASGQLLLVRAKFDAAQTTPDAPHQWFWDGHEHVDPQKEAAAQAQRLASNTTTLATEYARQGKDWETELRQRAKEIALMKELGLPVGQAPGASPAAPPATDPQQATEGNPDEADQPQSEAA